MRHKATTTRYPIIAQRYMPVTMHCKGARLRNQFSDHRDCIYLTGADMNGLRGSNAVREYTIKFIGIAIHASGRCNVHSPENVPLPSHVSSIRLHHAHSPKHDDGVVHTCTHLPSASSGAACSEPIRLQRWCTLANSVDTRQIARVESP